MQLSAPQMTAAKLSSLVRALGARITRRQTVRGGRAKKSLTFAFASTPTRICRRCIGWLHAHSISSETTICAVRVPFGCDSRGQRQILRCLTPSHSQRIGHRGCEQPTQTMLCSKICGSEMRSLQRRDIRVRPGEDWRAMQLVADVLDSELEAFCKEHHGLYAFFSGAHCECCAKNFGGPRH